MDPVSVWTIAKTAGEISKKLYDLSKSLKDRDIKEQVHAIMDELHELKRSASELEDENRDLREKLRFKSDEYEFRTPFWYQKAHPERPLCPVCFAKNLAAPMGEPGQDCSQEYRKCLVCHNGVEISKVRSSPPVIRTDYGMR